MPNRILREGILTSDRVNQLDPGAEIFYRRLMSVVDDYGRFDGRTVMLKVACFPLRIDEVREADIPRWIASCVKAGLIVLYAVEGKQFLEMTDFRQAVRAKQSKYPPPAAGDPVRITCDADATHMRSRRTAHAPVVEVGDGVEDEGGITPQPPLSRRPSAALPAWIPTPEWEDWRKHRGRKLTAQAIAAQVAKLDALRQKGHDPAACIRLAIESGWATFYEPRGKPTNGQDKRAATAAAMYGANHAQPTNEPTDITAEARRVA